MLQCVAECSCRALEDAVGVLRCAAVCRSVLQYVACVAECCCRASMSLLRLSGAL